MQSKKKLRTYRRVKNCRAEIVFSGTSKNALKELSSRLSATAPLGMSANPSGSINIVVYIFNFYTWCGKLEPAG